MASETTEKCPQCGGRAEGFAVMCGPRTPGSDDMKCTTGVIACDFCGGLGIVESMIAERYRKGQELRDVRVKKLLTQRQMARWLRISPMLLNDIELGRVKMPERCERELREFGKES
jgi:hypothetical protein